MYTNTYMCYVHVHLSCDCSMEVINPRLDSITHVNRLGGHWSFLLINDRAYLCGLELFLLNWHNYMHVPNFIIVAILYNYYCIVQNHISFLILSWLNKTFCCYLKGLFTPYQHIAFTTSFQPLKATQPAVMRLVAVTG